MAKNTIHNQVLIFTVQFYPYYAIQLVFMLLPHCVYRISIFAKKISKTLQKSRFARFCKLFSRCFLQIFRSYTHSAAIAFTQTKLHSREKNLTVQINTRLRKVSLHIFTCLYVIILKYVLNNQLGFYLESLHIGKSVM